MTEEDYKSLCLLSAEALAIIESYKARLKEVSDSYVPKESGAQIENVRYRMTDDPNYAIVMTFRNYYRDSWDVYLPSSILWDFEGTAERVKVAREAKAAEEAQWEADRQTEAQKAREANERKEWRRLNRKFGVVKK